MTGGGCKKGMSACRGNACQHTHTHSHMEPDGAAGSTRETMFSDSVFDPLCGAKAKSRVPCVVCRSVQPSGCLHMCVCLCVCACVRVLVRKRTNIKATRVRVCVCVRANVIDAAHTKRRGECSMGLIVVWD